MSTTLSNVRDAQCKSIAAHVLLEALQNAQKAYAQSQEVLWGSVKKYVQTPDFQEYLKSLQVAKQPYKKEFRYSTDLLLHSHELIVDFYDGVWYYKLINAKGMEEHVEVSDEVFTITTRSDMFPAELNQLLYDTFFLPSSEGDE